MTTIKEKRLTLPIPEHSTEVSGILQMPNKASALLVLAHGAGAGMEHRTLQALAEVLHARGIATLRFQFIYMEQGSRRPDLAPVAMATVAAVVREARRLVPELPLFAGGKSFGGRMTTQAASKEMLEGVRGLILFGFPLHPAKKPATTRAEHLAKVSIPALFLQGTRDALAELDLIQKVLRPYRDHFTLKILEGADHGFAVLKSSGRTESQVLEEIASLCADFCAAHRSQR